MSRTTAVAVVVAFTLVLACVPAAQASPFGGPSLDTRAGWFDVALSWLSGLLFGQETSSRETRTTFGAAQAIEPSLDDHAAPLSGGCMDPEGRPRPCY